MKVENVIEEMEKLAPESLKEEWDNVGLLIGDKKSEVKKILLCLDVTDEVVDESIELKANLIISHHPVIFSGMKTINFDDATGKKIIKIIKNDINVFCMHTNLDSCKGGTNDVLFDYLKLSNKEILINNGDDTGLGRIGENETPMSLEKYLKFVKDKLNIKYISYAKDNDGIGKQIKKVAVCTGACDNYFIKVAKEKNCDVIVTGDLKYHTGQLAKELGIVIIDASHYETENIVLDDLKSYIENNIEVKVEISNVNGQSIEIC